MFKNDAYAIASVGKRYSRETYKSTLIANEIKILLNV